MGRLSKIKIKYQLFILFLIMIVVIFIIQYYFFVIFKRIFTAQILDNFTRLATSLQIRIENTHDDIEKTADTLISLVDIKEYLAGRKDTEYVQGILDDNTVDSEAIYSIMICNCYKQMVLSKHREPEIFNKIISEYRLFEKYVPLPFYTAIYRQEIDESFLYGHVIPINIEKKEIFYENNYGLCIILCKVGSIRAIIDTIILGRDYEYLLIDNDKVIISNNENYIGHTLPLWIEDIYKMSLKNHKQNTFYHSKKAYLFRAYELKGNAWKLFCIAPMTEIEKQGSSFWGKALWALGFLSIIFGIVIFSVIQNITRPITYIINSLGALSNFNDSHKILLIGNNEVEEIIIHINKMLERMKKLHNKSINSQNEMFLAKLNEKQAQIYTLQSQIKPHFLYNTLGCLKNSATKGEMDKVDSIVDSLIKIFRYSIKGEEVVKLNDEIVCIKEYFHIFEIRYDYRISIVIDVDENILEKKIPRMILQPIMENALVHGVEKSMEGGVICVKGFIDKDMNIKIIIEDNGMGIPEKELLALNKRLINCKNEILIPVDINTSIGLSNVNSRIKFYFGSEYGIHIKSILGEGTLVIITIPFI